jgi:hypothetical protein
MASSSSLDPTIYGRLAASIGVHLVEHLAGKGVIQENEGVQILHEALTHFGERGSAERDSAAAIIRSILVTDGQLDLAP